MCPANHLHSFINLLHILIFNFFLTFRCAQCFQPFPDGRFFEVCILRKLMWVFTLQPWENHPDLRIKIKIWVAKWSRCPIWISVQSLVRPGIIGIGGIIKIHIQYTVWWLFSKAAFIHQPEKPHYTTTYEVTRQAISPKPFINQTCNA